MKIVLTNPVGIDSGGWYIIPYASRWTTASLGHDDAFTYYPRDLAYLSSILKQESDHTVKLLDPCLERWDKETMVEKIVAETPDWVVIEDSSRTVDDDLWAMERIKERTGAKIVWTGQHATAFPEEMAKRADLVVCGEYLASLRDFFRNGPDPSIRIIPFDHDRLIDVADLPWPEDDDVSRYVYALKADNICDYRQIQIYATRGCPYRCAYCVVRHSYYGGPEFRRRPVDDVVAEIAAMVKKYPDLEGFFFDDEIHNADGAYVRKLCRAIIDAGLDHIKYEAMCAYAPFDRETLALMKEAGYYKVRVGVETASDTVADGIDLKGKYRPEKLHRFLDDAHTAGLSVYGTFTLGGIGATPEEDRRTIGLMSDLIETDLISDCQVSICTPQPGAPFYTWAKAEGLLADVDWQSFDGGEESVLSLPGYPANEIKAMRKEALEAYDVARERRDAARFEKQWPSSTAELQRPKRILVLRSSRAWHIKAVLKGIEAIWPDASVTALSTANDIQPLRRFAPTVRWLNAEYDGFLSWERLPETLRAVLFDFAPDLILVPVGYLHLRGVGNAQHIAERLSAKTVYVDAHARLHPMF